MPTTQAERVAVVDLDAGDWLLFDGRPARVDEVLDADDDDPAREVWLLLVTGERGVDADPDRCPAYRADDLVTRLRRASDPRAGRSW